MAEEVAEEEVAEEEVAEEEGVAGTMRVLALAEFASSPGTTAAVRWACKWALARYRQPRLMG